MTPAVRMLEAAGIEFSLHRYDHDPTVDGYAAEAADALSTEPGAVFKTLVVDAVRDRRGLAVAIVPADRRLDLKALGGALGAKRVAMCDADVAERATGCVVGGISPFGQRRRLPTVIDASCRERDTIYVSGGRRGLEIRVAPDDLIGQLAASVAPIAR